MKRLSDRLPGWMFNEYFFLIGPVIECSAVSFFFGWVVVRRFVADAWLWAYLPTAVGGVGILLYVVIKFQWEQWRDHSERTELQRQVYRLAERIRRECGEDIRGVGGGVVISVHQKGRSSLLVRRAPSSALERTDGQTSLLGSTAYLRWDWFGLTTVSLPTHYTAGVPGSTSEVTLISAETPALSAGVSFRQMRNFSSATKMDEEGLRLLVQQLETFLRYG